MTERQIAELLARCKITLGITTNVYDERLRQYMRSAHAEIIREGVKTLDADSVEDAETIVMYTCWLWNSRTSGRGMTDMLRRRLNNRIFSEKMRGE